MVTNCGYSINRAMSNRGHPKPDDAESESLRKMVREIIRTDFDGVQSHAASSLGLTKSTLNDFLNLRNNGGLAMRTAVAAYLRRPVEEVLAANGDLAKIRAKRTASMEVAFSKLPKWAELLAAAKAIDPSVPDWCWEMVAESSAWIHKPLTAATLVDLGRFFRAHFAPPQTVR